MRRTIEIDIRDLRAFGRHGADPGERDHPQPFDLDVHVDVHLEEGARPELCGTVDYARLHRRVMEIVSSTSFPLLEQLAAHIVDDVVGDPHVAAVRVTVAKPGCLGGATPAVTVRASRDAADGER